MATPYLSSASIASLGSRLLEEYIAGCPGDDGSRISPVRRLFVLYVTFDLLFTCLLWLICLVVVGGDALHLLLNDITHYSVYSSLFDIVMLAAGRFVILSLFYALLRLDHWSVVSVTTAASTVFLVAKLFFYKWYNSSSSTFTVGLIISSFILAWAELWFLDFRVFPKEARSREMLAKLQPCERDPLLLGYGSHRLYSDAASVTTSRFYSPLHSPPGSDIEEEDLTEASAFVARQKDLEYRRKGEEVLDLTWSILNSDGWTLEKQTVEGDTVHSQFIKNIGKYFLLTGIVEIEANQLLDELFYRTEDIPSWNPTVKSVQRLQSIDSCTDITYQVAADQGGLISSRDFVTLRHAGKRDNTFVACGISIQYPDMPSQTPHIRAENGPGGWLFTPVEDSPDKCKFQWLLNTNLKGWIPQYIIDQALSKVQLDYMIHIRRHIAQMKRHSPNVL